MVSPIALVIDGESVMEAHDNLYGVDPLIIHNLSVTMEDGTNLVITDDDARAYNIFGSCLRGEDGVNLETVYRPTQLLVPEIIAGVNASGDLCHTDGQNEAWQAEFLPTA